MTHDMCNKTHDMYNKACDMCNKTCDTRHIQHDMSKKTCHVLVRAPVTQDACYKAPSCLLSYKAPSLQSPLSTKPPLYKAPSLQGLLSEQDLLSCLRQTQACAVSFCSREGRVITSYKDATNGAESAASLRSLRSICGLRKTRDKEGVHKGCP